MSGHSSNTTIQELRAASPPWPWLTLSVLAVTACFTTAQFFWPAVLEGLRRDWGEFSTGEWWRIITPILVHDEGWSQIAFNFTAIAVVGILVERIYGPWRWLLFYFLAGLAGETAGYAWQPEGAGASVAGSGLLGALLAWLAMRPGIPWTACLGGMFGLVAAAAMTFQGDIHGPPILVGAALAIVLPVRLATAPTVV